MKIKRAQGEGQGRCRLCKSTVSWMCFLWEIEGKEGVYCSNCVNEISRKEDKGNITIIKRVVLNEDTSDIKILNKG